MKESSRVFDHMLRKRINPETKMVFEYLDKQQTVTVFEQELRKFISRSSQIKGKVKRIHSKFVLQMNVYPNSWMFLGLSPLHCEPYPCFWSRRKVVWVEANERR